MTSTQRPSPVAANADGAGEAETTRKLIRDFVETPPAKTMADVKAASDIYESAARKKGETPGKPTS